MSTTILRYLTVSTAIFLAGWQVNGWRLGEQIAEARADLEHQRVEFQIRSRAKEQQWQIQLQEAHDAAAKREQKLSADAAIARHAADRLRGDLADHQRRLPELTEQAVRDYATALGDVFGECTEEYRALAEIADRIDSDRQTLEDAWPK